LHFFFLGAIKEPYMANPTSLVAKPILDGIIKTAFDLIKETYSSIRGVKKDVERLSSNLTSIRGVLEDAENKQVTNPQLKVWLGKLKEAALDAEDILETFAAEAYHHRKKRQSAVRRSSSKYDTANKIKDISNRFDEIAKEKEQFHLDIQDNGGRSVTPNYTGFFVDKSDVVGREVDKERITHMILSNEFDKEGDVSVIPIIGMGGLGKTTLAQLVFNDERVSAHFESRMWVCVTAEFDLTRILKEMIQFHSKMKLDDSSTSHLQSRLLDFMRGQCFLLVLDDVWTQEYEEWDSLRVLLKQGAKGSRVLVTSRITTVGNVVGTQPSHCLDYLPDGECWSLFAKIAFGNIGTTLSSETRRDLEDSGREIVRKCQGLPLAVKAMGGLLRSHVDVSIWRQIQGSEIWEIEDKLKVMAILKLSYDHLPAHLKPCFEYCSLFPKSNVFCKTDLVKLWIAQGFIQSNIGYDTMEEAGIAYFSELLIRSFFQPSSVDNNEIFSMHDLIHDLAQSISSPNCCQVKDSKLCSFSEQSRHVFLLSKDVEQPMLEPMLEIVNNA